MQKNTNQQGVMNVNAEELSDESLVQSVLDNFVRYFASGDMTKDQAKEILQTLNIQYREDYENPELGWEYTRLEFEYNDKNYNIAYHYAQVMSAEDNNRTDTFTEKDILNQISSPAYIGEYFQEVGYNSNGKIYALKKGCGFATLEELKAHLATKSESSKSVVGTSESHYNSDMVNSYEQRGETHSFYTGQTNDDGYLYIKCHSYGDLIAYGYDIDESTIRLPGDREDTPITWEYVYTREVLDPIFEAQFGHKLEGYPYFWEKCTDEELQFINEHQDVFPWHFYSLENGEFSCRYVNGVYACSNPSLIELWATNNYNALYTPEEVYNDCIGDFKCSFITNETYNSRYNRDYEAHLKYYSEHGFSWSDYPTPYDFVSLNGYTVNFTDDSIKAIKTYLDAVKDGQLKYGYTSFEQSDYMKLFGFNVDDDEETIRLKIQAFCNSYGSSDGSSINLEDYYLVMTKSGIFQNGKTYSECVNGQNEYLQYLKDSMSSFASSARKSEIHHRSDGGLANEISTRIKSAATTTATTAETVTPDTTTDTSTSTTAAKATTTPTTTTTTTPTTTAPTTSASAARAKSVPSSSSFSAETAAKLNEIVKRKQNNEYINRSEMVALLNELGIPYEIETLLNARDENEYEVRLTYGYETYEFENPGNYVKITPIIIDSDKVKTLGVYPSDVEPTEEEFRAQKEEHIKNFINSYYVWIQEHDPHELSKDEKEMYSSHNSSDMVPVWQVDVFDDKNGVLVLSDGFASIVAEYLQLVYDNTNNHVGNNCGYQQEYMKMLGLPVMEEDESAESYKARVKEYIDNPELLKEKIKEFCTSLGSTDGKTVSIEAYYDALANNNVYRHWTATSFGPLFKNDEKIALEASRIKYMNELKALYPSLCENYDSYIKDILDSGISPGAAYLYALNSNGEDLYRFTNANDMSYGRTCANGMYYEALCLAAGIEDSDPLAQKEQKMITLFNKIGYNTASGSLYEMDSITLTNYLLGNNAEGINYFQTMVNNKTKYELGLNNAQEIIDSYNNNPTEPINDAKVDITPTMPKGADETKLTEIESYIISLTENIYNEYWYFDRGGSGSYKYFDKNTPSNSDERSRVCYTWKNEADKQACAAAFDAAAQKILEKYGDILTSLVFDGEKFVYTTIYDDFLLNNNSGTAPAQSSSTTDIYVGHSRFVAGECEPCIDTPKNYKTVTVYDNIPEGVPAGINGETVMKTQWDGIFVSENYLYIWNAREEKFQVMGSNTSDFQSHIISGNVDAIVYDWKSLTEEYREILFAAVYGYKLTNSTDIYEKDGKLYMIDLGRLSSYPITNKAHYQMVEIEGDYVVENGINTPTAATKGTTVTSPDSEEDDENTPTTRTKGTTATYPATKGVDETEASTDSEDSIRTRIRDSLTSIGNIIKTNVNNIIDNIKEIKEKKAEELGLTKGDDGNYYTKDGQTVFMYVWNAWENAFDKFVVCTEDEDKDVELIPNSQGIFDAVKSTLSDIFAELSLKAEKYGLIPTNELGIFELEGERYVYDVDAKQFIKEARAAVQKIKTWSQTYIEAIKLAKELGYKVSSYGFCIFEDKDGNKYKYDTEKQEFVKI